MSDPQKAPRPKSRLGRGLSSLMSMTEPPVAAPRVSVEGADAGRDLPSGSDGPTAGARSNFIEPGVRVSELPLDSIVPNPHQPRREFNDASLAELAESLKSTGMVQPIIVRPEGQGGDRYQLIAGERRWRAAKLAQLATVPAIIRDVDGATQAQMALVENIQREDLNPLDRALAYQSLLNHLGLTQAELATRLGEERTTVAHFLRLLDLDAPVQDQVRSGKLSMGHAKLLAGVTDKAEQRRLADLIVSQGLSVRNLERLIAAGPSKPPTPPADMAAKPSAHLQDLERSLSRQLSMRVQVRSSRRQKGQGKLILHYSSLDQFDELMSKLGVRSD